MLITDDSISIKDKTAKTPSLLRLTSAFRTPLGITLTFTPAPADSSYHFNCVVRRNGHSVPFGISQRELLKDGQLAGNVVVCSFGDAPPQELLPVSETIYGKIKDNTDNFIDRICAQLERQPT